MRVQVLYFGVLKDVFGGESEMMELAEGACVADLLMVCRGRAGGPDGLWESIAVAVNQEYARGDGLLREGDAVALLPPVSGGCVREQVQVQVQVQKQMRGFFASLRMTGGVVGCGVGDAG